METVEAVIINWKRPENVERIVERLREQTWPCSVTIVDCAVDQESKLSPGVIQSADHYYALRNNYLAFSRYVPAFNYVSDFTFLIDDDMLPGVRCVEHLVKSAKIRPDAGALGQLGRIIKGPYQGKDVPRLDGEFVMVDLLVRAYFVRTECFPYVLQLRQKINSTIREDDMLLAIAIKHLARRTVLLTPLDPDPSTLMNEQELPELHALSQNPQHLRLREQFWWNTWTVAEGVRPLAGPERIIATQKRFSYRFLGALADGKIALGHIKRTIKSVCRS